MPFSRQEMPRTILLRGIATVRTLSRALNWSHKLPPRLRPLFHRREEMIDTDALQVISQRTRQVQITALKTAMTLRYRKKLSQNSNIFFQKFLSEFSDLVSKSNSGQFVLVVKRWTINRNKMYLNF